MIQVVWVFLVREPAVNRFRRTYGPRGTWARLFSRYPGFLGTTLLSDSRNPRRFLTVDRWQTLRHRERMLVHARREYEALDRACAPLTESEAEVGIFKTPTSRA